MYGHYVMHLQAKSIPLDARGGPSPGSNRKTLLDVHHHVAVNAGSGPGLDAVYFGKCQQLCFGVFLQHLPAASSQHSIPMAHGVAGYSLRYGKSRPRDSFGCGHIYWDVLVSYVSWANRLPVKYIYTPVAVSIHLSTSHSGAAGPKPPAG